MLFLLSIDWAQKIDKISQIEPIFVLNRGLKAAQIIYRPARPAGLVDNEILDDRLRKIEDFTTFPQGEASHPRANKSYRPVAQGLPRGHFILSTGRAAPSLAPHPPRSPHRGGLWRCWSLLLLFFLVFPGC